MTNYRSLIADAVEGLDLNTGKARRTLYERARASQVTQLRATDPPLSESVIAKERLALEDAIRKVETDAARESGTKSRGPRSDIAPPRLGAARADSERSEQVRPKDSPVALAESEAPRPGPPSAERLRRWLTGKRGGGSGDGVNEAHRLDTAAMSAKDGSETTEGPTPSQTWPPADGETPPSSSDVKSGAHAENPRTAHDEEVVLHPGRHLPQAMEDEHLQALTPRSYRKLVRAVVMLLLLAALAATMYSQWQQFSELYRYVAQIGAKQQPSNAAQQTPTQPKFLGRVPQEQNIAQAPAAATSDSKASAAKAQRVVLYEEDSSETQGKRYDGLVRWRTETVSPGPSPAPELAVRADVEIPERHTTMTLLLRRSIDHALPASHAVEIMFNLPADFAAGGVASVPGIMMKPSEQVPGTPLAKLAVKAANGVFMIELSASDADAQRNGQLLKESQWFDIPIVYINGSRAILAIEKDPPGDLVFVEAFAAWDKK